MRLVVAGASGRTGQELVRVAVERGHEVVGLARTSRRDLPGRTLAVDLTEPGELLAEALVGADAVLSCLGPNRRGDAGTVHVATRHLAAAMTSAGVRRLVAVSASPVAQMTGHRPTGDDVLTRLILAPLLRLLLRRTYVDLAAMEEVLRGSGLAWTVVRPPRLTDGRADVAVRTAIGRNVTGGRTVSRRALATAMLDLLDDPATIGRAVGVAI